MVWPLGATSRAAFQIPVRPSEDSDTGDAAGETLARAPEDDMGNRSGVAALMSRYAAY